MRRAWTGAARGIAGALWLVTAQLAAEPSDGLGGRVPALWEHGRAEPPLDTAGEAGPQGPAEEPATRPKGIRPPWRDHWIPELRHVPGKRARRFTAEAA
jgi:hypothetical protein